MTCANKRGVRPAAGTRRGEVGRRAICLGSRRATQAALVLLTGMGLSCSSSSKQSPPKPKPPEVTISEVIARPVIDREVFTGRLEAVESVEIRSRVRGYLNEVKFKEGQEVKAGDLLFQIDPRTFEAELKNAEGLKAQWIAKRDKAQADVSRYENLVPTGAASAQDLDKARAEQGEAVAAIQSADAAIEQARLDLEFSRITAPIDGQVGAALITKGNLVLADSSGEDAVLTTIVSMNPIYVYFSVNERTLLRFRDRHRATLEEGQVLPAVNDLKIPIQLGLANETGFPHEGVIDFADNTIDPSTGTIRVRATVDNSRRFFKPGLFARIQIPVSNSYEAILVSQAAIGTDQGKKYVLVVDDKNIVERRFVDPGPLQANGLQVIADGLKKGEWVVVNGTQRARPGNPVTPQKADMPMTRVGKPPAEPTSQPAHNS